MKIIFEESELQMIDSALYYAIEDVKNYLRYGSPGKDLDPEDFEKLKTMPDKWLKLRRKIQSLLTSENGLDEKQSAQSFNSGTEKLR